MKEVYIEVVVSLKSIVLVLIDLFFAFSKRVFKKYRK